MVSDDGSLVCMLQLPSTFCVPWFRFQPAGTPLIVSVVAAPVPDGSPNPRLIALPAIPAGFVVVKVPWFPSRSVAVTINVLLFLTFVPLSVNV
jgi:hypothetical protein